MGVWRSTAVSGGRHGSGRVVLFFVALGLLGSGCGHSGHGAATDSEKAGDVEVLNDSLVRELTAIDAYTRGVARLRGQNLALARQLRGQDQAYVDALTKAIRGLGGETDAEAEAPESPRPRDEAEALALAYEGENLALSGALAAAPRLQTPAPRALAAALSAGHAQHLVVLRQALGADPLAAVPAPFEPGDTPPPQAAKGTAARPEGSSRPPQAVKGG